jgi:peptidoglycan/xylan/chitin deacetylase (PgdA/CDA1 family)
MPKLGIVFLMYHELEIAGRQLCQSEPGYSRYVVPEGSFLSQMDYLKQNGWQGLSVTEGLEFPEGRNVTITFDDGCETDLLAAAPILRQNGFKATFFVTCGKLGSRGYLSEFQLRELSRQGFEIGCHSMTHPYLTDLNEKDLQHEIVEAKSQLEQIIGKPVDHFSCPGGRCSQKVVSVARSAGYRSVATSRIESNSRGTDAFGLGRVAILRDVSLEAFAAICEGRSLRRMRAKSSFHHAARQILGNPFYDLVRATLLRRQNPVR